MTPLYYDETDSWPVSEPLRPVRCGYTGRVFRFSTREYMRDLVPAKRTDRKFDPNNWVPRALGLRPTKRKRQRKKNLKRWRARYE